jgi:hypothetical protein
MSALPAGPYVIEYGIVIANLTHSFEFNCDTLGTATPGQDPTTLLMAARSESEEVTLQEAADEMWGKYRPLLSPGHQCSTYTLWKMGSTNTQRLFISGGVLTTPNGAGVGSYIPAQQMTLTFRSATGRIGRFVAMETAYAGNGQIPLNPAGGIEYTDAFAAYILSGRNVACARDRSFFVQGLNDSRGQNEAIFEERFRS